MSFDVNNPYFRNQVLTAPPEQLRMMLLDGCLRFLGEAREGLAAKDYEKSFSGFTQAKNIIMELINALRPEIAPELCERLQALYVFIYRQLTEASFEKDLAKLDETIKLVEYERETWVLLLEKLKQDRGGEVDRGAGPAGHAAPRAARDQAAPRTPLSFSA